MADPDATHPWTDVIAAERAFLDTRHAGARPYATGLALSGGGIRSAAVSLGVLQVLAGARLLSHLDYLSVVSGGGYIGSALALRLAQAADAAAAEGVIRSPEDVFSYGTVTATSATDSAELEHFRHHADYLAPHGFGSLATGFFIVARAILLNLFIWITIGGALLATLMWAAALLRHWPAAAGALFMGATCDRYFFLLLLWAAALILTLLALSVAGISLSSWWVRSDGKTRRRSRLAWWVILVVAVVWAVLAVLHIPPLAAPQAAVAPAVATAIPPGACRIPSTFAGVGTMTLSDAVQLTLPILILLAIFVPLLSQRLAPFLGDDLASAGANLSVKYARRQVQERLAGILVTVALALAVLGAVPFVADVLTFYFGSPPADTSLPRFVGQQMRGEHGVEGAQRLPLHLFLVYLGSGAAALVGYYNAHIRGRFGLPTAVVVIVGSVLLVFGATLIAHQVALRLFGLGWPWLWFWDNPAGNHLEAWPQAAAAAATLAAIALAIFVNANDMSLQRFYRDRLMEAFMPDRRPAPPDGALEPVPGPATVADRTTLSSLGLERPAERGSTRMVPRVPIGPYPIINSYLLARRYRGGPSQADRDAQEDRDLALLANRIRDRRGDSFILSPCFVGSTLTRWRRTDAVIDDQLTVPTAMAISGAAVNPGGGLAGRGVTANYATAVAMALLSLRLGYRMRWRQVGWLRTTLNPYGNHVFPGISEILGELLGRRSSDDPAFVELSDGGHFDNLGLYELVRRRCRLILVCDGGEDPTGSYAAFISVMTMMREDFGVEVRFDRSLDGERCDPAQLVARETPDEYPKGAEFAERGFFLATIRYAAHDDTLDTCRVTGGAAKDRRAADLGLVIYLKAAMLKELGLASRGYKGAHPEFPYEPTSDQFFPPEQFSAYLDVGNQIALQMLRETRLASFFASGERPDLDRLLAAFPPLPT